MVFGREGSINAFRPSTITLHLPFPPLTDIVLLVVRLFFFVSKTNKKGPPLPVNHQCNCPSQMRKLGKMSLQTALRALPSLFWEGGCTCISATGNAERSETFRPPTGNARNCSQECKCTYSVRVGVCGCACG